MITLIFRLYVTYLKKNPETGEIYVGVASALVENTGEKSIQKVLSRRENAPHHKNKEGFSRAEADRVSTDRAAIRGREQMLFEHFQKQGTAAEQRNPVGPRNPKRSEYLKTAAAVFGDLLILVLWF